MTLARLFLRCAVLSVAGLLALPLRAEPVVVLSGQVGDLGPGSVVDSATPVDLPAGAVLVVNDATGQTRTIAGPYAGPIGNSASAGGDGGLVASLGQLVASRDAEQSTLGAIRSAPGQTTRDPQVLTVTNSSVQCAPADGAIRLWRPGTMDVDSRLAITDMATNARTEVIWHAGDAALAWPAGLPATDGGRYRIELDVAPRAIELELHFVPTGLDATDRLAAWMSGVGCRRQALLLLGTIGS